MSRVWYDEYGDPVETAAERQSRLDDCNAQAEAERQRRAEGERIALEERADYFDRSNRQGLSMYTWITRRGD